MGMPLHFFWVPMRLAREMTDCYVHTCNWIEVGCLAVCYNYRRGSTKNGCSSWACRLSRYLMHVLMLLWLATYWQRDVDQVQVS
jgi:hypothetical protein